MKKKSNGSDKDKIVPFRTLAEKEREQKKQRKAQEKQEKAWQKSYRNQANSNTPPMFNFGRIPDFSKYFSLFLVLFSTPLLLKPDLKIQAIFNLGFIPENLTNGASIPLYHLHTFLTHALIHESWTDLIISALFLLALGTFFERIYGTKTTIIFFAATTLAGALAYLILGFSSSIPMVGTAAGTSGLFAAALLQLYKQKQAQGLSLPITPKAFKPWQIIAFWAALMLGISLLFGAPLAYNTHIAGFLTGAALIHALNTGKLHF